MFFNAKSFNQPLNFNTNNVTNMTNMFSFASAFNQQLNFNTSKVTNMTNMFYAASSFNQDISNWNVINIPTLPTNFKASSALTEQNTPIWGTTGN